MNLEEEKKKESTFTWEGQEQLDRAWESYLQREAFAYDPEKDPLYRQYARKYTQLGKLAMEDAVGTASALTGGYANSYAQIAGQQAYDRYIQRLNDVLPTLQQDAYERYMAEGEALYDEAVLRQEQRDRAYREYLDQQSWQNKLEQQEYQRQQDAMAMQLQQEKFAYQQQQDALDREQEQSRLVYQQQQDSQSQEWEREQREYERRENNYNRLLELIASGYRPSDGELTAAGMTREQADALAAYAQKAASSSGRGSGGGSVSYDTQGYKKSDIKALQEAAGLVVDGVWGPETQQVYEEGWRREGTANTQRVMATMLEESKLTPHELVAYGSYADYVAYTILSSGLTDREEDYLLRLYRQEHPEFGASWGSQSHLDTLRARGLI